MYNPNTKQPLNGSDVFIHKYLEISVIQFFSFAEYVRDLLNSIHVGIRVEMQEASKLKREFKTPMYWSRVGFSSVTI